MMPGQVAAVRHSLGMTQVELAQLIGVHPLTVSKWERGQTSPSSYQAAMLSSFQGAAQRQSGVGETVRGLLVGAGIAAAVYMLLKVALEEDD